MLETALVDGDIVAYRCAAAAENDEEGIAKWQTSEMMNRILHETNAMQYRVFLTGESNFRYSIYPDYKANRRDMPRPRWLQSVREHLVSVWGSSVTDGIEADDAMGIEQVALNNAGEDSVICSIDKDMLMIPGRHYNFVRNEFRNISPLEGLRNFYAQLIMGDRTDNIPGYDGKMRSKIPKFLMSHMEVLYNSMTEKEMFDHVREMYGDDARMLLSGQCLWIQRKENDLWQFPLEGGLDRGPDESVHHIGSEGGEPPLSSEV